jgi:carbonic anhydrase
MNPEVALQNLMEGNERFVTGMRCVEPMLSHTKMGDLAANGQKPFAIVLTCSDSRSPVELIFDQGVGQLFVIRVAGNVVAPSLLASIEYAAANLGSSLIMVMGHTQCGAVTATYQHTLKPATPMPSTHLQELVDRIKPAVDKIKLSHASTPEPELIELCSIENVKQSMELIAKQSEIVGNLCQEGKIKIYGSVLDIKTGKVNLIE